MEKETHVYCTECANFKLEEDNNGAFIIPNICKDCWFWDFEDSRPFEIRKNYIPLK